MLSEVRQPHEENRGGQGQWTKKFITQSLGLQISYSVCSKVP